jgi:uncharacterized cupredoxin-like copper-binding protein
MELKEQVSRFLDVPMSYEDMLEITMAVESYYRRNNYLARVILPPQDLTDGVLTVDVIESVFSRVEIEQELADLPNTQAHVAAIIESHQRIGEPLNAKSLDRALALANDLPGISAQGTLRQGREAGETELLLKLYQGRTRQTELTFDNAAAVPLPHNVIVGKAGSKDALFAAAMKIATDPQGMAKGYVPDDANVLAHTKLVQPGQKETIEFVLPAAGAYPYMCTFPGHSILMNGVITAE